jgi:integrase
MARNYGTGTVRTRGNGFELRWYVKEDGKYHTKAYKGTEAAARKELKKLTAQVDAGTYTAPTKLTVGEICGQYLNLHASTLENKTRVRYEDIINGYIIPQFGKIAVDKLNPLDIDAWYKDLQKSGSKTGKGLSPNTVHHYHVVLNQVFNWAGKKRIIKENIAKCATAPKMRKQEMEIISKTELLTLLAACADSPWGMPIIISGLTGARLGECLALTWDDVHYDMQQLDIHHSLEYISGQYKVKDTKNTASYREVGIRQMLIDALKRHHEIQNLQKLEWGGAYQDNNLVCAREDGSFMQGTNITRAMQALLKTLKIKKIRFHDLRHTFASIMLQTAQVQVVSKALGHKSIRVTLETYAHVMPGDNGLAADAFELALTAAKPTTSNQN